VVTQEAGAAGRVATRGNEIDKIQSATLVQSADRASARATRFDEHTFNE
jgi:hypothetical protein